MSNRTTVAIVGAGPTGLTAALCLNQLGIDCFVFDKKSEPISTSNALAVQARTLEIWDSLGIIHEALDKGMPIQALNIYNDKEKIARIALDKLKTPYPYILGLPQVETERILVRKLSSLGTTIHRKCELKSILQQSHVEITYIDENSEQQHLTANWLLGCDGSHSLTRELLKIPYLGNNLPQHFIMADLPLISSLSRNEAHGFLSSQGVVAVISMRSFCRLIIDVTHEPSLAQTKEPKLEIFQKLSKERSFIPLELGEPLWTSGFWIHEHVAQSYSHDRVFLLGDAAHEHSPIGGQGMNTGIQDAFNLCWKIALVEKKKAQSSLLTSYEKERLPVAKTVVSATTFATKILTSKTTLVRQLFKKVLYLLPRISFFQRNATEVISLLKVNYAKSGTCGQNGVWLNGIKPGLRAPLELTPLSSILTYDKFNLLLFSGTASLNDEDLRTFITAVNQQFPSFFHFTIVQNQPILDPPVATIDDFDDTLHRRFGITKPSYYLIRPDQYIAYRGQGFNIHTLSQFLEHNGITRMSF